MSIRHAEGCNAYPAFGAAGSFREYPISLFSHAGIADFIPLGRDPDCRGIATASRALYGSARIVDVKSRKLRRGRPPKWGVR